MGTALRNLQLAELELLKKVLKFFDKNGISYYALGGTLLGAVRHKGFIPWDDDIDLGVPREDYDRLPELLQAAKIEFSAFQCNKNHPGYTLRIIDRKVNVRKHLAQKESIESAWIDIFPLDGMPNHKWPRKLHILHILYRRMVFIMSRFQTCADMQKKNRPLLERVLIKFCLHFPVEKVLNPSKAFNKLDRALKAYPYTKSNYLVNAMGAYKFKEMFHKKYYGEGAWYPFEDIQIRGPVDYDTVLTQLYGDYMLPPPKDDRNHHSVVEIIFKEENV